MKKAMINRHDYPELDLILWDMADVHVEPEVAFRMYEQRWRHVDEKMLTTKEKQLIEQLKRTCGNGYMLVA
jgi:hypothetical protein